MLEILLFWKHHESTPRRGRAMTSMLGRLGAVIFGPARLIEESLLARGSSTSQGSQACPHTLTPSHPHTLTPSKLHTLTPSHPHTHTLTPTHPQQARVGVRELRNANGAAIRIFYPAAEVLWWFGALYYTYIASSSHLTWKLKDTRPSASELRPTGQEDASIAAPSRKPTPMFRNSMAFVTEGWVDTFLKPVVPSFVLSVLKFFFSYLALLGPLQKTKLPRCFEGLPPVDAKKGPLTLNPQPQPINL